jgi:aryl-alcohol dehydrogenase-like predicted oxidoreductase
MRHALKLGVNWIDTAAVCGLGHSEEVVGRLLRERTPAELAPPQRVLKPESIRQECDTSLRRLGLERIDLYQFHWPDETGTPIEDSWNGNGATDQGG